jgi:hypothetical protein
VTCGALSALALAPCILLACSDHVPAGVEPPSPPALHVENTPVGPIPTVVPPPPRVIYETSFATTPSLFASKSTLEGIGLGYGIPDGSLGVIKIGTGYTFFGSGGAGAANCDGGCTEGVYTLEGSSLTTMVAPPPKVSAPLFGPGALATAGATDWIFDRNYAGGGQVVSYEGTRFVIAGTEVHPEAYTGYIMPYHGEYQYGPTCNEVPCYYAGIGLAVSYDTGGTFTAAGQIVQPYPPVGYYDGDSATHQNVGNAYGSLVVADASGHHLANPPPDPSSAYFYLFYQDVDPYAGTVPPGQTAVDSNPGICVYSCLAVARAPYESVVSALTPPTIDNGRVERIDPATRAANVAALFTKYYAPASSGATWTQPATSDGNEDEWSGQFTALFGDTGAGMPSVIYDTVSSEYLMAFMTNDLAAVQKFDDQGICIRASTDLVHWTPASTPGSDPPCLAFYKTAPSGGTNFTEVYTSFIGDGVDPQTGGAAPRVFFQEFEAFDNDAGSNAFPKPWNEYNVGLESIAVNVTRFAF